jgi:polynucleotide 5'-hydroxyl-kinase GRC3/NOL9
VARDERTIQAEAGETIVIAGPASFELLQGEATILGAPLDSYRHVVTHGKQTPIEIASSSSLRIHLGQDAHLEELDGSTIPHSWREAASALAELEEGTVVVIGGADSGKTTLCTYLSNLLIQGSKQVAVVDADIGQTDMGPPTTMAAGEITQPVVSLSRVEASERLFIGVTSPGRAKGKVIRSVRRLLACHAKPSKLVIVNTDGWVSGSEAVAYKLEMLDQLEPDLTLGIGIESHASTILQTASRASLLLGSPDTIRERSRVDRKELRTLGYQKYLAGSSLRTLRLNGVRLWNAVGAEALDLHRLSWSRAVHLKDALVGFLGAEGFLLEIGVLKEIVPSAMIVRVWSRVTSALSRIEVGNVRLSSDGRELGYVGE